MKKILYVLAIFVGLNNVAFAENIDVKITTELGEIELELYQDKAPKTVANFLKYVDADYYSGGSFYRSVRMDNQVQNEHKIEVIQGGVAYGGGENSFDPVALENTNETGIKHLDGVISMARGEPVSATSEFFICVNDQPELDYGGRRHSDGKGFAAFGKVTKGMDIVKLIQDQKRDIPDMDNLEYTSGQMIIKPVKIISIIRN